MICWYLYEIIHKILKVQNMQIVEIKTKDLFLMEHLGNFWFFVASRLILLFLILLWARESQPEDICQRLTFLVDSLGVRLASSG